MRILYVENHAIFADNVTRQFLSQHSVTVVPSLSAARQILNATKFDLLLVDYDLEDGKGDELVRECQSPVCQFLQSASRHRTKGMPLYVGRVLERFAAKWNSIRFRLSLRKSFKEQARNPRGNIQNSSGL